MAETNEAKSTTLPWWVTAASILIVPVVLTFITQYTTYRAQKDEALQKIETAGKDAATKIETLKSEAEQKSRELDIRMVEIALSLLKPDPNADPDKIGAREWAINVMEKYSGVKFSEAARKSIIATSVPVDKGILQGTPASSAPSGPPLPPVIERIGGLDNVAILDEPAHVAQWTKPDGTPIDFSQPISDILIKSVGANTTLIGGQVHGAYMGASSTGVDFFKYLKAVGSKVSPGTCFRLIATYKDRFGGILFGKVEDAGCS